MTSHWYGPTAMVEHLGVDKGGGGGRQGYGCPGSGVME